MRGPEEVALAYVERINHGDLDRVDSGWPGQGMAYTLR